MVIFGHSCITCRKATIPSLDSLSASCFWLQCRSFSVSYHLHVIAADTLMWRDFYWWLLIRHYRQSGRKLCTRNLGSKIFDSCSLFGLAWLHHFYGCMERVCSIHHCQKRPIRHHFASQHLPCYPCLCSSSLSYIERHWLRPIQARAMWCHFSLGDCFLLMGSLWSCNSLGWMVLCIWWWVLIKYAWRDNCIATRSLDSLASTCSCTGIHHLADRGKKRAFPFVTCMHRQTLSGSSFQITCFTCSHLSISWWSTARLTQRRENAFSTRQQPIEVILTHNIFSICLLKTHMTNQST